MGSSRPAPVMPVSRIATESSRPQARPATVPPRNRRLSLPRGSRSVLALLPQPLARAQNDGVTQTGVSPSAGGSDRMHTWLSRLYQGRRAHYVVGHLAAVYLIVAVVAAIGCVVWTRVVGQGATSALVAIAAIIGSTWVARSGV
jgi:hypothetical protein